MQHSILNGQTHHIKFDSVSGNTMGSTLFPSKCTRPAVEMYMASFWRCFWNGAKNATLRFCCFICCLAALETEHENLGTGKTMAHVCSICSRCCFESCLQLLGSGHCTMIQNLSDGAFVVRVLPAKINSLLFILNPMECTASQTPSGWPILRASFEPLH